MRPRMRLTIVLLALTIGVLGLAAPASANFITIGVDPAGDSIDPTAARDIVKVGLAYDRRTGHIKGGVVLRGLRPRSRPRT